MRVGFSAHNSAAGVGAGNGMGPRFLKGLTPLLCWGAILLIMILFRVESWLTSSFTPAGFTNPQKRGWASGAEKIPLLGGGASAVVGCNNTGGFESAHFGHTFVNHYEVIKLKSRCGDSRERGFTSLVEVVEHNMSDGA